MKNNKQPLVDKFSENDIEKIVKNSPSLQKHFEESRQILNRISKQEWAKVTQR